MSSAEHSFREVTIDLFHHWVGQNAERLDASRYGFAAEAAIRNALTDEFDFERAGEIAFHLADWAADAAFL